MTIDRTKIRASFDCAHLARLNHFRAVNDIRYYLAGLFIQRCDKGGVYLVSCDGHTMAVVHDATGSIEGADDVIMVVSPDLVRASKTARSINGIKPRILLDGQRARIALAFDSVGGHEHFVQAGYSQLEAKYPEWRKVVPDFAKLKRGAFGGMSGVNARLLARLEKLTPASKWGGLNFWHANTDSAVVIQIDHVPEMIVLIMPMRGNTDEQQRKWFDPFIASKSAEPERVAEPA